MTDATVPDSTPAGAPAAFLRGVERRAVVLAELQCGSAARGDAAVAAALRAFARTARDVPMATWPARFWSLLLAAPDLRRNADGATWPAPWAALATIGNGPRVALLLRLIAALEMDDAAGALGVSPEAYRAALQRAIPYRDDGSPDRETWQAWVAQVRAAIDGMDPTRLARLHAPPALVRTAEAPTPAPVVVASTTGARSRHWLALGTIVIAGAGIATAIALHPHWVERLPFRGALVRTAPLPPADPPASTYDAELAAWTHRDFLAIADPEGVARADTLPFFAWYAATLAVQPAPDAATPAPTASSAPVPVTAAVLAEPAPVFVAPPRAQPLSVPHHVAVPDDMLRLIARVPAPQQMELQDQARLWRSWTSAQRALFATHAAQWNARPRAVQVRLRERYLAWRALDAVAQEAVENAVQAFAHRSVEEQAALHAEFDALDPLAQRGWLLGPALGVDYPKLQPLLAQLPEAQHAPMLRALRRMGAAERADLAVLAQRVPPQERAELVRTLLSTADAQRAAWLQVRLAQ